MIWPLKSGLFSSDFKWCVQIRSFDIRTLSHGLNIGLVGIQMFVVVYSPCNESISIKVVHGEGPFQLLFQLSPWGDRQGAEELPEVNGAVTVGIERSEDMLRKFWRVAVGEEIAINLFKFFDAELPVGAVLKESLVPFLKCKEMTKYWKNSKQPFKTGYFCLYWHSLTSILNYSENLNTEHLNTGNFWLMSNFLEFSFQMAN
jgi:hypothetical protein